MNDKCIEGLSDYAMVSGKYLANENYDHCINRKGKLSTYGVII